MEETNEKIISILLVITMMALLAPMVFAEDSIIEVTEAEVAEIIALSENGDVEAQGLLGIMYAEGIGVEQDFTEAAIWLSRAVKADDVRAMKYLGIMYCYVLGVKGDAEKGMSLLMKASELGDVASTLDIAKIYMKMVPQFLLQEILTQQLLGMKRQSTWAV